MVERDADVGHLGGVEGVEGHRETEGAGARDLDVPVQLHRPLAADLDLVQRACMVAHALGSCGMHARATYPYQHQILGRCEHWTRTYDPNKYPFLTNIHVQAE